MRGQWGVDVSREGYELIAPDGQRLGLFASLEAALVQMRDVQRESLKHTAPFVYVAPKDRRR